MEFQLTFQESISGVANFVTGLTQADITFVRADNHSTVVDYTFFDEIGDGQYKFGTFDVPEVSLNLITGQWNPSVVLVLPRISGVIQQGFSEIAVWNDAYIPVSTGDVYPRVDKLGDTVLNHLTYDISLSGVNGFDPFNIPQDSYYRFRLPAVGWVLNTLSASLSGINTTGSLSGYATTSSLSGYVTTNTEQTITGPKTFYLSSSGFKMQMQSTPPNGGVYGWESKPLAANQMLHDFKNSAVTGTGSFLCSTASINTSSSKYIVGNPSNNDFVWKKWVSDNFTPLAGGYNSYTIIVDPTAPVVLGKQYPTINGAIADVTASLSITERYTLLVKQPDESVYTEDIEVPDWLNIIGEGQIKIFGQLTRTGASPDISSKLENLYFVNNIAAAHDVDRFHVTNCVFDVNGSVVITDSICNGSGFYGSTITSGNGNRIMNCFGNQSVAWQSSDRIYSYNYIVDDYYAY